MSPAKILERLFVFGLDWLSLTFRFPTLLSELWWPKWVGYELAEGPIYDRVAWRANPVDLRASSTNRGPSGQFKPIKWFQ